jgi:HK97 family phage major capsid protein
MPNLLELRRQLTHITGAADDLVTHAQNEHRAMTASENQRYTTMIADTAPQLQAMIAGIEKNNTMHKAFPSLAKSGVLLTDARAGANPFKADVKQLSPEYLGAFTKMLVTGGREMSAVLYEGVSGDGGYAVPITVDDQIVPLAPSEMSIRQLATVIPTSNDIKFPTKTTFGTAAAKAETSAFGGTQPVIGQFTLSAYMAGTQQEISWELAQDVPAFQAFCVDDMLLDQQMYEENLYVNGTGSGQAQGLLGNVGAGVTEEPDSNGNLVSINGTLDLIGTLNAAYFTNASWLMSRLTSIAIRKSQVETNLFNPVWQRFGTQDFLHGFPVSYSAAMPTAARGNTPILFGDFKRGYIIGDRGGSGINVKVLDQPLATQGLIVLLAYRRTDGRVRRSEAIQSYTIAAS